ncbi:hypothetical protein V495_03228, partial [Pseudogymnoascus sp. VKM F-4514 (FW-929)]
MVSIVFRTLWPKDPKKPSSSVAAAPDRGCTLLEPALGGAVERDAP